jgi:hypothetical protein
VAKYLPDLPKVVEPNNNSNHYKNLFRAVEFLFCSWPKNTACFGNTASSLNMFAPFRLVNTIENLSKILT